MQAKILVVDDRADNLLSMESLLDKGGYRIVKANSGKEALKILLHELDFALILMDVKMPVLNGFETAAMIYEREKLKNIPIIFVTAFSEDEETIFRGYQAGAIDYIYKPVNPDILRAKVAVLVELYMKTQKLQAQELKLTAINKSLELEVIERKASEEKIKQLNYKLLENIANLEAANKDLDRFAFMASHDMQEPLRKIRVFCDRLWSKGKDVLDQDCKHDLNRIVNAAERMQNLISDILAFSQLSAEKVSFLQYDLNDLVAEVLNEMDEDVKRKEALIKVDRLPSLPVNPGLIRPLFHNLISNSLKYCKKGIPPEITIRIKKDASQKNGDSQYCHILIEDNGIGFDQKYADEIFGMFRRLHRTSEFEGTGIGLALCKKIVEQHKGYLSAQSKVNEGATFIISLPVEQ
ncbi:MAG TPA: response regulator [Ohtaekwangia sp.]